MGLLKKLFGMADDMPQPEEEAVEMVTDSGEEMPEQPMEEKGAEEAAQEEVM